MSGSSSGEPTFFPARFCSAAWRPGLSSDEQQQQQQQHQQ
jgi:hypothetical protein